jgi:glyoxalase family protein
MTHNGIHHVTAITRNARRNLEFYSRILGLRFVKKTVNFDDPGTYHLYYGDEVGRPGTLLTFYCWPGAIRGRPGTGQTIATAPAVPPGTLVAWRRRLTAHGVLAEGPAPRGAGQVLAFHDPDGLALDLVAHPSVTGWPAARGRQIPARQAIRGLYGVTLRVAECTLTETFLTAALGLRLLDEDRIGGLRCYGFDGEGPGASTIGVSRCA